MNVVPYEHPFIYILYICIFINDIELNDDRSMTDDINATNIIFSFAGHSFAKVADGICANIGFQRR